MNRGCCVRSPRSTFWSYRPIREIESKDQKDRLSLIEGETRNESYYSPDQGTDVAGVCSIFLLQRRRIRSGGNEFAAKPLRRAERDRLIVRRNGLADLGRGYVPGQQRSISVCRLGELDRTGAIISARPVQRPQGA